MDVEALLGHLRQPALHTPSFRFITALSNCSLHTNYANYNENDQIYANIQWLV